MKIENGMTFVLDGTANAATALFAELICDGVAPA
jgi:hypothetical protein